MVKQTRRVRGGFKLSNLNPFKTKQVNVRNPLNVAAEEQQKAHEEALKSQCVNSINTQISLYIKYIDNLNTIPQSIQTYIKKNTNNGGVAYNNTSQYEEDINQEFENKKRKLRDYINSNFDTYYRECNEYINDGLSHAFSIWVQFDTAKLIPLFKYNSMNLLERRSLNDVLKDYYQDARQYYYGGKRKQTRRNKRTQKRRKN